MIRARRENRGLVRKELVLNIDIPATILDLAGLPIPDKYQGCSLKPLLERGKPAWRNEIFCEELWDNPEIPQSECVRTQQWKYIQYPKHPEYVELFDLETDPQEKHNLARSPQYQSILNELRNHCQQWIQRLVEDRKKFR